MLEFFQQNWLIAFLLGSLIGFIIATSLDWSFIFRSKSPDVNIDIDGLKNDKQRLQTELNAQVETGKGLNLKLGDLQIENTDLRARLDTCANTRMELEGKLRDVNQDYAGLQARFSELEAQNNNLNLQLGGFQTRIGSLESHNNDLSLRLSQMDDVNVKLGDLDSINLSLANRLKELEAMNVDLSAKLQASDNLAGMNLRLEQDNASLQAKLNATLADLDAIKADNARIAGAADLEMERLRSELVLAGSGETLSGGADLVAQVGTLEAINAGLREKMAELESENQDYQIRLHQLGSLGTNDDDMNNWLVNLEQSGKNPDWSVRLAELEADNASLKARLQEVEGINVGLESRLLQYEGNISGKVGSVSLPDVDLSAELPKIDLPDVDVSGDLGGVSLPDVDLSAELPKIDLPDVDLSAELPKIDLPDVDVSGDLGGVSLPDV
ncbi:MAG TPA: hypothetical protein PK299_04770, partial [Anaerolineales bacterium]|nr:hypothetical protein [Anaerolineales bacterium]